MRSSFFIAPIALVLAVSGCTVEGPMGPPGNANVFSSTFMFRVADAQISGPVASAQFDMPAITNAVVDGGAVLMFFEEQGTWTAMPFTFGQEAPDLPAVDFIITIGYGFARGLLEVFYEASTTAISLRSQPDRRMKVVVIEGFALNKTSLDTSNHEAVMDFFGLMD
jgi:hypothetical protein